MCVKFLLVVVVVVVHPHWLPARSKRKREPWELCLGWASRGNRPRDPTPPVGVSCLPTNKLPNVKLTWKARIAGHSSPWDYLWYHWWYGSICVSVWYGSTYIVKLPKTVLAKWMIFGTTISGSVQTIWLSVTFNLRHGVTWNHPIMWHSFASPVVMKSGEHVWFLMRNWGWCTIKALWTSY